METRIPIYACPADLTARPPDLSQGELLPRGVELDPLYVDVIVRRYEATTGDAATLVETGETYEALGARRGREAAPVWGLSSGAPPEVT